jgi:hypothetical protein
MIDYVSSAQDYRYVGENIIVEIFLNCVLEKVVIDSSVLTIHFVCLFTHRTTGGLGRRVSYTSYNSIIGINL